MIDNHCRDCIIIMLRRAAFAENNREKRHKWQKN